MGKWQLKVTLTPCDNGSTTAQRQQPTKESPDDDKKPELNTEQRPHMLKAFAPEEGDADTNEKSALLKRKGTNGTEMSQFDALTRTELQNDYDDDAGSVAVSEAELLPDEDSGIQQRTSRDEDEFETEILEDTGCSEGTNDSRVWDQEIEDDVQDKFTPQAAEMDSDARGNPLQLQTTTEANSGRQWYPCDRPECNRIFRLKGVLKAHQRSHKMERIFVCSQPLCGKRFGHLEGLRRHNLLNHKGMKQFRCPTCSKQFVRPANLLAHMETHAPENTDEQSIDDEDVPTRELFPSENLMEESTPDPVEGVKQKPETNSMYRDRRTCELCSRRFKTESDKDEHIWRHDQMKYICAAPSCYCLFENFTTLQGHFRKNHNSTLKVAGKMHCLIKPKSSEDSRSNTSKTHKCDMCRREFLTKAVRDYHVAHHSEMIYKCPEPCGFLFPDFARLIKHHWFKHETSLSTGDEHVYRINNHFSEECKENNPLHPRSKMKSNNRYSISGGGKQNKWSSRLMCQICKRKFMNETRKNFHEAHHGEMKYKCSCGNMYRDFKPLVSHGYDSHSIRLTREDCNQYRIKTVLKLVRNTKTNRWSADPGHNWDTVRCHICKRRFRSKLTRDHHVAQHKEMVYRCPDPCGHMFVDFSRLQDHSRNNHQKCLSGKFQHQFRVNKLKWRPELGCTMCDRKFHNKEWKDQHVANHNNMVYKCPHATCRNLFIHFFVLQKHARRCHDKHLFKKHEAQYRVDSSTSIEEHAKELKRQSRSVAGNQSVTMAQKVVNTEKMAAKNNNLKNDKLQCHLCKRQFRTLENRNCHVENHSKMLYRCSECGYMYMKRQVCNKHFAACHRNALSRGCKNQPKSSVAVSNIRQHFSARNPHVLSHCPQCNICQRMFRTAIARDEHFARHQEMRYKCPDPCGSMFIDFKYLQKHVCNRHEFRLHKEDRGRCKIKEDSFQASDATDGQKTRNENKDQETEQEPTTQPKETVPKQTYSSTQATTYQLPKDVNVEKPTSNREIIENAKTDNKTEFVGGSVSNSRKSGVRHKVVRKAENKKYECPVIQPTCGEQFPNFEALHQHCQDSHILYLKKEDEKGYRIKVPRRPRKNLGKPRCASCRRIFKTEARRDDHIKKHDQMKFRCIVEQCGFLYEDVSNLRYHFQKFHKVKLSKMDENRCLLNYTEDNPSTDNDVDSFEESDQKDMDDGRYLTNAIEENPSIYIDRGIFQEECKDSNNPPKEKESHTCELCTRVLPTEEDRKLHLLNHENMVFKCPGWQCYNLFIDIETLREHIDEHHVFKLEEHEEEYCRIEGNGSSDVVKRKGNPLSNKHLFNMKGHEEEYCRIDHNDNVVKRSTNPLSGVIYQKGGIEVGTLDIHPMKSGNSVEPLMCKTDFHSSGHAKPSRMIEHTVGKPECTMVEPQIDSTVQIDSATQQLVDDITWRLVRNLVLIQNCNLQPAINSHAQSLNTGTIQQYEENMPSDDTTQCAVENAKSKPNDESLDSTFELTTTILDPTLLDQTFNTFNSEELDALLNGDDVTKVENEPESPSLKIAHSFSPPTDVLPEDVDFDTLSTSPAFVAAAVNSALNENLQSTTVDYPTIPSANAFSQNDASADSGIDDFTEIPCTSPPEPNTAQPESSLQPFDENSRSVILIVDDDEGDKKDTVLQNYDEVGPSERKPDIAITDLIQAKRRKLCDLVSPEYDATATSAELFLGGRTNAMKQEVPRSGSARTESEALPKDASELFCLSLVPIMRRLGKCKESVARMMIQQAMHKVEFGQVSEGSSQEASSDVNEMCGITLAAYGAQDDNEVSQSAMVDESGGTEDELFCLSLAPTLRELDRQKQSLAKFRIHEVLHKCQFYKGSS